MLLLLSPGGKHVDAHVGGPSVRCQEAGSDVHKQRKRKRRTAWPIIALSCQIDVYPLSHVLCTVVF